jgi:hypothetical protein
VSVAGDMLASAKGGVMWDQPSSGNARAYDPAHHSLAALLMARGERFAAGIVAMSHYRSDCVDNWDGGQFLVTLDVPAQAYDQARNDLYPSLSAACEDIVGSEHYAGLHLGVLAPVEDSEWASKLIDILRLRRVPSERLDVAPLEAGVSAS